MTGSWSIQIPPFVPSSFCITIIERLRFSGVSVVELGARTSLPGLVAAKVGSDVTLTDDANIPEVMGLTWSMWDADIFGIHHIIILGADVLYDTSAFDDLFATGISAPKFSSIRFHDNLSQ